MLKTFIEIGSCDFGTNMPLIESGEWLGVMVEPAPYYFNNLQTLADKVKHKDNLHLENIAISDYNGDISFACALPPSKESRGHGSEWRRGISSVVADNHLGERMFDLEGNQKFIDEVIDVPCMTLDSLIAKYKWEHINYLKIDVEGHEQNILDVYSWDIKPDIIKLEHSHVDDTYIKLLLEKHGYLVYVEQNDIYAIK